MSRGMRSADVTDFSMSTSMTNTSSLLTFDNVSMTFDDGTRALDNVSFGVKPGEFVTVVGPSGCGKSTTSALRIPLEIRHGEHRECH